MLKALIFPKTLFDSNCKERESNVLSELEVFDSVINWTELFLLRKKFTDGDFRFSNSAFFSLKIDGARRKP